MGELTGSFPGAERRVDPLRPELFLVQIPVAVGTPCGLAMAARAGAPGLGRGRAAAVFARWDKRRNRKSQCRSGGGGKPRPPEREQPAAGVWGGPPPRPG